MAECRSRNCQGDWYWIKVGPQNEDQRRWKCNECGAEHPSACANSEKQDSGSAVAWGPEKQDYPGGPIYRVGTSTGITLPPQPSLGTEKLLRDLLDRGYKMHVMAGTVRVAEHNPDHNDPLIAWLSDVRSVLYGNTKPTPEVPLG